jgi:uncharacterized membrane protein YkvA (DUF1232 family)
MKASRRPMARTGSRKRRAAAAHPILDVSDVRAILSDLAQQLAPADVAELIAQEEDLRARAVELEMPEFALLRNQLELALDCLHDHVAGACPQIPFSTIALLAAAVQYFADEVDVIPDFLPHVGRLDDGAIMAMACQLAQDGLERSCISTGRSPYSILGTARPKRPRPRAQ